MFRFISEISVFVRRRSSPCFPANVCSSSYCRYEAGVRQVPCSSHLTPAPPHTHTHTHTHTPLPAFFQTSRHTDIPVSTVPTQQAQLTAGKVDFEILLPP